MKPAHAAIAAEILKRRARLPTPSLGSPHPSNPLALVFNPPSSLKMDAEALSAFMSNFGGGFLMATFVAVLYVIES